MSQHDVNRRTITKGLAWAVPAVSAAAALPAYAVSCPGHCRGRDRFMVRRLPVEPA